MRKGIVRATGGDLSLSKIVLGTCYYGTDIPKDIAYDMLDMYYAAGGRTLDTARVYGLDAAERSASERTVGDWMKSRGVRDEMLLVTKGGHPQLYDLHVSRLSEGEIYADFEASMRDLSTDRADVYFLHRDDTSIPVGEIMNILDRLVKEGRVRALGASNWSLSRILEANAYALEKGKTPFSVSQIQWSLAHSTPEAWNDDTLVCMTDAEYAGYLKAGIPVMAYSPQAKGIFSKYIAGGEAALGRKIRERFLTDLNLRRIERVRALSAESGLSPAAIALGYITCNPLEGFAIVGCSSAAQLRDSLSAADLEMDISALTE